MEIIILFIMWGITVPVCLKSAEKIGSNKTIAVLAGLFLPIIGAIGYAYAASNSKDGKVNTDEVWKQIGKLVVWGIVIYVVSQWIISLFNF
jgi:Kef-type K+ transport system membrane component KefB